MGKCLKEKIIQTNRRKTTERKQKGDNKIEQSQRGLMKEEILTSIQEGNKGGNIIKTTHTDKLKFNRKKD